MRQKFLISQDGANKRLKISEYAAIGKKNRNDASAGQRDEKFSLLCEETYADAVILRSIASGISALVVALRTANLFPIERYAIRSPNPLWRSTIPAKTLPWSCFLTMPTCCSRKRRFLKTPETPEYELT